MFQRYVVRLPLLARKTISNVKEFPMKENDAVEGDTSRKPFHFILCKIFVRASLLASSTKGEDERSTSAKWNSFIIAKLNFTAAVTIQ
jgi:hypothetical protein